MSLRTVALLAAAPLVLVAGCSSDKPKPPSPSASHRNAVANREVDHAVKAIKLCRVDNDGEYPSSLKDVTGSITMLCGPVSEGLTLSPGTKMTYTPHGSSFTIVITTKDGTVFTYDSKTGKTTSS